MTVEEIVEILEGEKDEHNPNDRNILLSDKFYRYGVQYGLNLAISYIKKELTEKSAHSLISAAISEASRLTEANAMSNAIVSINEMPEWVHVEKAERQQLGRFLASLIQHAEELAQDGKI